jgi:transcriptional regulator with XRE-family HTH domain
MSASTAGLGLRIATTRNARRLSQLELADLASVSPSMIRKVEQGSRAPSDEILHAIADALQVTAEHLLDGPGRSDSRVHLAVPAIQDAIATYDLPDDGPIRPLDQLAAAVHATVERRVNAQYARLVDRLPELLQELARAVDTHRGHDRQQAAALLASAYRSADAVAYKHGYRDLSARLVELMRWAAQISGAPEVAAAAAYVRTETYFAASQLPTGLRALQRAIDAAPAPDTAPLRAGVGALHMRAAVVAGRMRDTGTAREHLAEARRLTGTIREGLYCGTAVGPDSLQIHTLAVAVELNDTQDLRGAVTAASSWSPPRDLPSERRSHYYIDLGRAQMQLGQPKHALESLLVARAIAPQHVREHGQVRAELATMVRLDRGRDQRLVSFAQWARAV